MVFLLRPGMVLAIEPMVNEGDPQLNCAQRWLDGKNKRWQTMQPL